MRFSVFFATVIFAFSGAALSYDAIQLDINKANFQEQHAKILQEINTNANYAEISAYDRKTVVQGLSRIGEILGDSQFSTLQAEQRQQITEEQQQVNLSLTKAKNDSRLVCKMVMILGTNLKSKVCHTVASLARESEKTRDYLNAERKN
jgi:hypothetical protein